jgi:hypothetical protein
MNQMQVDIEERGFAFGLDDYVLFPDFFEERFWGGHCVPLELLAFSF